MVPGLFYLSHAMISKPLPHTLVCVCFKQDSGYSIHKKSDGILPLELFETTLGTSFFTILLQPFSALCPQTT